MKALQLRDYVIRPTLELFGLHSDAAELLLLGTAAHESHMGEYLHQVGGPALGIYQMEPATHADIWDNFLRYREDKFAAAKSLLPKEMPGGYDNQLVVNLAYATFMARMQYYRRPEPLPAANDLPALAAYYKKFYNTPAGAATEQDFIDACMRFFPELI